MEVVWIAQTEELAPLADAWNRLAPNPFCSWDWLEAWWRHYGGAASGSGLAQLLVLAVYDDAGELAGVAPWYIERTLSRGWTVRCLGSGEVLSDYLTVPCREGFENEVAQALADWLTTDASASGAVRERRPRWSLLELTGVAPADRTVAYLARHLSFRRCAKRIAVEGNCWRVRLPGRWDDFVDGLSKSHRKQVRRLERRLFDSGRAVLHPVEESQELDDAWAILTYLHQRRSHSLGRPGVFSSPAFAAFHHDVAHRMFRAGRLQLSWIELDGRPVAADYHLAQDGVVYAYQGGVEPDALADEPGRLMTMATIRRAIGRGYRGFDFLRGDEPYKAHWRALPRNSLRLRFVPENPVARLRDGLATAMDRGKQWIKQGLQTVAPREDSVANPASDFAELL